MVKRTMQPGDRIRVQWGDREVAGVVTSVSGDRIHVALTIEGADEPISAPFRSDQLLPA